MEEGKRGWQERRVGGSDHIKNLLFFWSSTPQENVTPTDPANESVFHGGGLGKSGVARGEGLVMQKHNVQLEAGFEHEWNENTFREDTQLNLI